MYNRGYQTCGIITRIFFYFSKKKDKNQLKKNTLELQMLTTAIITEKISVQ